MIGKSVGGYRIVSQIGMGGMATVFKAHDAKMDRYVALKILPQQYAKDPHFQQRFAQEAKAIAQLEHLHILPIFDYGEDEGISFMAMRYMETGTLTDFIRTHSPIPLPEIARIIKQIASALDHAHEHGILHRDIKPSNVLVDNKHNTYLTDFGIAKILESSADLTGTGIVGTPQYMSPEQCAASRDITAASDQYALGIVLYEMVTGRTPYQAETPMAIINMLILNEPLIPPGELREISSTTEGVILKALAREPKDRYPTCMALAEAFNTSLDSQKDQKTQMITRQRQSQPEVVPVVADTPDQPTLRPDFTRPAATSASAKAPKQRPTALIVLALVVAVALVGVALLALTSNSDESIAPVVAKESEILVKCEEYDATEADGICIVHLPSNEIERIVDGYGDMTSHNLSLSPDAQRIAFAVPLGEGLSDIYVVNRDGSDLQQLFFGVPVANPSWRPDGEWLAFQFGAGIAVAHPDGSAIRIVWNDDEHPGDQPQWSPDGEMIAFWSWPNQVLVVPFEGGDAIELTDEGVFTGCDRLLDGVGFSPDGSQVVFFGLDCSEYYLINADGSGEPERIAEFPFWWTKRYFPQWQEPPSEG